MIRLDHEHAGTVVGRCYGDFHRVASAVTRLVQGEFHLVGARFLAQVFIVPAVARKKWIDRGQLGFGVENLESIAAPFDRKVHAHPLTGGEVDVLLTDLLQLDVGIRFPIVAVFVKPVKVADLPL